MTTIYLLALILAVNGDRMTINKGLIDGLQPGDIGTIYYTLTVNGAQEKAVEVGKCEVTSVEDFAGTAKLIGQRLPVQSGYEVRFHCPAERVTPAALLTVAKERLQQG